MEASEAIQLQRLLLNAYEEKIALLEQRIVEKDAALEKAEQKATRVQVCNNKEGTFNLKELEMLLVRLRSDDGHCDAFYLPDDAVIEDAKSRFCEKFRLDPDTTHLRVFGIRALPDEPLEVAEGQEIFVETVKTQTWLVSVNGKLFELPAGRRPSKQDLYKLAMEAAPGCDFVYINSDGNYLLRPDDTTELDKVTLAGSIIEIIHIPKGNHGPSERSLKTKIANVKAVIEEEDPGNHKRPIPDEDDHSWKRNCLSTPDMAYV